MGLFNCKCQSNCTAVALIVSVIVGVIAAFLQITGAIAVSAPFLWALFGIGVVYLGVLVIAAALTRERVRSCCPCTPLNAVLAGILGTILAAVVLLAVTLPATSVLLAILVGLLVLFFTLLLTATACLVRCLADCAGDAVLLE